MLETLLDNAVASAAGFGIGCVTGYCYRKMQEQLEKVRVRKHDHTRAD